MTEEQRKAELIRKIQLIEKIKAAESTSKALDTAGGEAEAIVSGALDYPGGLARTAAFAPIATKEDLLKALKGQAPSSSEYMSRAGVPEGYSLSDVLPGMYSETGRELTKFQKGGVLDPSARGAIGFAGDVVLDPFTYVSGGAAKGGTKLGKSVFTPLTELSEYFGKKIYKSGLKRIDQEAAKYGKEPVSDLLMQKGITGSAESIQKQMDALGDELYKSRQQILKDATKAGAEVSMKDAMAPTIARIQEIRASKNPNLQPLADALEIEVKRFTDLDAKQAQPILRDLPVQGEMAGGYSDVKIIPQEERLGSLPVQGELAGGSSQIKILPPSQKIDELPYGHGRKIFGPKDKVVSGPMPSTITLDEVPGKIVPGKTKPDKFSKRPEQVTYEVIPGKTIPGVTHPDEFITRKPVVVYDMTEATRGPNPLQASGYKTSVSSSLPQSAFADRNMIREAQKAEKSVAGGLKSATESSVERAIGQGDKLRELNDQLGRILTTRDKQALEAMKEQNKNLITSVDAPLAGADIKLALLKKAADIAKMTGTRTRAGKGLVDFSRWTQTYPGIPDSIARRSLWEILREQQGAE